MSVRESDRMTVILGELIIGWRPLNYPNQGGSEECEPPGNGSQCYDLKQTKPASFSTSWGPLSPLKKPLGTPLALKLHVRRWFPFILIPMLWFKAVFSLPHFRLVWTSWGPLSPLKKPLETSLAWEMCVRRAFSFIVIPMLWFATIFSLPHYRPVRTSWSPSFGTPWGPL